MDSARQVGSMHDGSNSPWNKLVAPVSIGISWRKHSNYVGIIAVSAADSILAVTFQSKVARRINFVNEFTTPTVLNAVVVAWHFRQLRQAFW